MKNIKLVLLAMLLLIGSPAFAAEPGEPSAEAVANYLAANPKPQLPEEARKYRVQAEFAVQQKQFDRAADLYGKVLEIAPWWPEGHFNRAVILGEMKKYREAMRDMQWYVKLAPGAPDARAAQDKIYQWETFVPKEFRDCPDCPAMVTIPEKGYALGKYEVTFDEWDACVEAGGCSGYKPNDGSNPLFGTTTHWGRGSRPVINVSWNDAQTYVSWLSKKTGKTYRLPAEEEWEYACYGGHKTEYCGSNNIDEVAWYDRNSERQTHPVGQKQPNGYGLYDMSGNVWEWTNDCWEGDCGRRVLRGGSWYFNAVNLSAANRVYNASTDRGRYYDNGFRLARKLP